MTKAEIQAASEFWASGPGAKVMARWRIEWPVDNGPQFIKRLLPPDADMGWGICLLRDEQAVREIPLPDRAAVHTIHGHYLDLLAKAFDVCRLVTLGSQGVVMGFYNLDDGEESEIAVNGSTLHEALAAAMEAAFGDEQ